MPQEQGGHCTEGLWALVHPLCGGREGTPEAMQLQGLAQPHPGRREKLCCYGGRDSVTSKAHKTESTWEQLCPLAA